MLDPLSLFIGVLLCGVIYLASAASDALEAWSDHRGAQADELAARTDLHRQQQQESERREELAKLQIGWAVNERKRQHVGVS